MANHYVNGEGKTLTVNHEVYLSSVIVRDTVSAMKKHIQVLSGSNKPFAFLKSGDPSFLNSSVGAEMKRGKRNVNTQGYILPDGALLVEQTNHRLKNADHRFHLTVNSSKAGQKFLSLWRIESLYDFEPFSKGYVTDIPLAKNFILKLPDGLSHYLTKIGVARDFTYISQWQETWS